MYIIKSMPAGDLVMQGATTICFSIMILFQWKICFNVTPLLSMILLQIFANAMTAQMSCHAQNLIMINSQQYGWKQNVISIEFEIWREKLLWNGPQDYFTIRYCCNHIIASFRRWQNRYTFLCEVIVFRLRFQWSLFPRLEFICTIKSLI